MANATEKIIHDLRGMALAALAIVERSLSRYRIRRLMRELAPRHVAQLGFSPADEAEASQWFWEA